MQIQVNTDNHISNTEEFAAELKSSIAHTLEKFSSHITRVEIFLRDENSTKGGSDDKKCSIEARLQGLKPLAASHNAGTLRDAFHGASKKIERVVREAIHQQRGD